MKITKQTVIAAMALLMANADLHAEVFKCKIGESKTVYQPAPCAGTEVTTIEIKRRSAEKEAKAANELKQWQAKYETAEAADKAAMKAEHEQRLREAEVSAAERNAVAQAGQWEAERRQAQAMEEGKSRPIVVIGK